MITPRRYWCLAFYFLSHFFCKHLWHIKHVTKHWSLMFSRWGFSVQWQSMIFFHFSKWRHDQVSLERRKKNRKNINENICVYRSDLVFIFSSYFVQNFIFTSPKMNEKTRFEFHLHTRPLNDMFAVSHFGWMSFQSINWFRTETIFSIMLIYYFAMFDNVRSEEWKSCKKLSEQEIKDCRKIRQKKSKVEKLCP